MERGDGVVTQGGVRVRLDKGERTIMFEARGGANVGRIETRRAMLAAADLHAVHSFTRCAAVDGSLKEEIPAGGGLRRTLAYGIWEGPRGDVWRSQAVRRGPATRGQRQDGRAAAT